ncbi:MAG: DUF5615 family PIN-like protein [Planctomycetota bacterium]
MRYLIDAQLPRRAVDWLTTSESDAIHTLDLPDGNRTPDSAIIKRADLDGRVVVTKDADFVDAHLMQNRPARLLLISIGNLSNPGLQALLEPLTPTLNHQFKTRRFLELTHHGLLIRD